MKVIKQFYVNGDKTYYVGDEYNGVIFKGSEKYLEQPKTSEVFTKEEKTKAKRKSKK